MDDFISVITQTADRVSGKNPRQRAAAKRCSVRRCRRPVFPTDPARPAAGTSIWCVSRWGQALGRECQQMGVGILLGPGINIRRTPLAGRGYEYYAEDPVVSGDIAAALINGLQQEGVGASLKHFAANNSGIPAHRNGFDHRRTGAAKSIWPVFQRAIAKSRPWTVMSSYNRLNGVQTSQDPFLLTQVLRAMSGATMEW